MEWRTSERTKTDKRRTNERTNERAARAITINMMMNNNKSPYSQSVAAAVAAATSTTLFQLAATDRGAVASSLGASLSPLLFSSLRWLMALCCGGCQFAARRGCSSRRRRRRLPQPQSKAKGLESFCCLFVCFGGGELRHDALTSLPAAVVAFSLSEASQMSKP